MLTLGVASHLRLVCVRCDLNRILNGVVLIIQDGRIFQRYIWRGFGFHTRFELVDVAFDNSAIADLYAVCDRTRSLLYNARYPLIWTTVVSSQYSFSRNQGTRLGMLVMLCFCLACFDIICSFAFGLIRSKQVHSGRFRKSSTGETPVVACGVARYSDKNSAKR